MSEALPDEPIEFPIPRGIELVEIDPETGLLYGPDCPTRFVEAYLEGTAPKEVCGKHGYSSSEQ